MDPHIKQDVLDVLHHAVSALRREDIKALIELSNMTVHNASIHQDQYSIVVAVLVYSLSKLFERTKYQQYPDWHIFCQDCVTRLSEAEESLLHDDYGKFDQLIHTFLESIKQSDPKLQQYMQDVFLKAKISKASRIYEHGISLGRTAELLGVSQYDLMSYVGKTYVADVQENKTLSVKKRLALARGIFL